MDRLRKSNYRTAIAERVQFDLVEFISQNIRWLRWAMIFLCYLVVTLLGLLTTRFNPLYAVIASFAPLLVLLAQLPLKRFDLIPIIILVSALFIPLSLPTGTGSRLVFSLILSVFFLLLWVMRSMTVDKRFSLQPFPVNLPVIGFSMVTFFSIFWSIIFRDPLVFTPGTFLIVQIAAGMVMVMLPVTLLMVGNFIQGIKHLKWMVILMLVAGYAGLLKNFLNVNIPVDIRGLFSLWIISISYGLLLFMRKLGWYWRVLLVLLLAGWIYWNFIVGITWLAGWLPGMVAMAILTFMRSKKLALIVGILLLAFFLSKRDYYLGKVLQNEDQESGVTRLAAWKANWSITRNHLLFGTGPAGYAVYYMSYFPSDAMATHNNYIDIVSQTGIVGTVFMLWIFLGIAWEGGKVCKRLKGRYDFAEAMGNIAFAGIIACILIMAFGDWLFPFAYTQTIAGFNYAVYNWLFMGSVLVLDRLTPGT